MNKVNAIKFFRVFARILIAFGLCQHGHPADKPILEKQAKEKAIAERIAFEKEAAQKRMAQMEEDKRRAALRQKQAVQPQISPPIPLTPQAQIHHEGKSFASSLMGGTISAAKSTNPYDVPGFQTDRPKEASLTNGTIGDAARAESKSNEVSQHVVSSAQDRPKFKIDPDTDPLLIEANQVVSDPQKALNEDIVAIPDSGESVSEEIKTCFEGGDAYSQSCTKRLEITLKIKPATTSTSYSCPGHTKKHWQWHGFRSRTVETTSYCKGCVATHTTVNKVVEIASEKWVDGCTALEDLTEKGLCRYNTKTISRKNETRVIQGEPITRDHFEENYNYTCFKTPAVSNTCTGLRQKGCYQINSLCKEKVGNTCVIWQQTYSCPSGKKSMKSYQANPSQASLSQTSLFCLTGNCADTSYEANNEMMNAMGHLYALREAQNDLRDFKVIFKGTHRSCTRNCLSFRDCCGSGNGWGVTLHLSDCDKAEIELGTLRDKRLCIQVGTYCAERDKFLKICLRKKTTFCCYGTKLARLIQENGRAQLALGWGRVESPDCNGLSPEQLSRIDFSKINFAEIFEDIQSKTVVKDQKQSLAALSTERLQDNMTILTKPSPDANDQQKQQALKEKGL